MVITYLGDRVPELDVEKELKESVFKNLNIPGLVNDVLDKVAEPALRNAVAKSDTKIDDMLVAALLPLLQGELKDLVKSQWEKLFLSNGGKSGGEGDPV